jgi:PAS domain S-box-containing protein
MKVKMNAFDKLKTIVQKDLEAKKEYSSVNKADDTKRAARTENYYYKKWLATQKRLEESEKLNLELFNSFPHPALAWENTKEGLVLINANAHYRNFSKGEITNLIGKKATEIWKDEPDLINYLNLCSTKKEFISTEYNYSFNSGEKRSDVLLNFSYMPPGNVFLYMEDISLFKSAERIVDDKENELDQIIEDIPVGVGILSYMGRVAKLNRKFTEMFGYTQKEIPTIKEFFQLIYSNENKKEKAYDVFLKLLNRANKQNRNLKPIVFELKCKNNESCYSEIKINTIGEYSLVTFNDITDLLKSQIAMQKSADIIESIQVGMFIYHLEDIHDDRTLRLVKVNPASSVLTGSDTNIMVGKTIDEAFPYLRELNIPQKYARVVRTQKPIEFEEISYLDSENFERAYSVKAFPLPDHHVGVSFENITNQKKTEEDLRTSEEKFRQMAENASDIIFLTDPSLRLTYLSPATKTILQYDPSELLNTYTWDLLTPLSRNYLARRMEVLQAEWDQGNFNSPGKNSEIEMIRKDGSTIWIELRGSAILDKNKEIVGLSGVCRDISERKAAEDEIRDALEKAEESDKLKSAFLANISHEIRTPLNGILGFTGMLEKPEISVEKRQQFVQYIQSSGNQLLKIISDIVDLSKIETGQVEIMNHKTNLNSFFGNLLSQVEQEKITANKQDIQIIMNLGSEKPDFEAELDNIRLKQILDGLLNNALKFIKKGKIEFGYSIQSSEMLQFYVKDTGIGISKEKQEVIFNRFRQEDDSFTRKFGGTGLGLSICKGLIELMGGKIWVESEKEKGTAFFFTLPCRIVNKEKIPQKTVTPEKKYNWQDKTLLIVEDETIMVEYLKIILDKTGINIHYAKNGQEAIEKCKLPDIDLVLMDIRLPVMNGYDATRIIRSTRADLPIIAQTANALPQDRVLALESGCNDFITKPVDRVQLLDLIDQYLVEKTI